MLLYYNVDVLVPSSISIMTRLETRTSAWIGLIIVYSISGWLCTQNSVCEHFSSNQWRERERERWLFNIRRNSGVDQTGLRVNVRTTKSSKKSTPTAACTHCATNGNARHRVCMRATNTVLNSTEFSGDMWTKVCIASERTVSARVACSWLSACSRVPIEKSRPLTTCIWMPRNESVLYCAYGSWSKHHRNNMLYNV